MSDSVAFGPYSVIRAVAASSLYVSFAARFAPAEHDVLVTLGVFKPGMMGPAHLPEALLGHAERVRRLNHVNLTSLFDVCLHDGLPYTVSEFVDGVPLEALNEAVGVGARAVNSDVTAFICSELCAGLSHAHTRRDERGRPLHLVHGGVDPGRVVLSKTGLVKLIDFVVPGATREAGLIDREPEQRMPFAAPELVRGEAFDQRADIFSVGAIAFQQLTGRHIYAHQHENDLESAAAQGFAPRVRDIDRAIPIELGDIVDKALSPTPEDRFKDAGEMRAALGEFLRSHAPGFGRHRLKTYVSRLVPGSTHGLLPGREWCALQRKEFEPIDGASLIHEVEAPFKGPRASLTELMHTPDLPKLNSVDVRRMLSGAHPSLSREPRLASNDARPSERMLQAMRESAIAAALLEDEVTRRTPVVERFELARREAQVTPVASAPVVESVATEVYDDRVSDDFLQQAAEEALDEEAFRRGGLGAGPILVLLLIIAAAGIGVYQVVRPPQDGNAGLESGLTVFVTSRPQGAELIIDGSRSGLRTPVPLTVNAPIALSAELSGYETPDTLLVDGARSSVSFSFVPE
ncbi:MAG: serine/threonine protein kinase [Bradymonadia bacterium]|jgi:serine/threonine protein kinase